MIAAYRALLGSWVRKTLIPAEYHPETGAKPKSNDWLPGFRWIPRWWRFIAFPMAPLAGWGGLENRWVKIELGYPLAPDTQRRIALGPNPETGQLEQQDQMLACDAVQDGRTGFITVYHPVFKVRAVAYFSASPIIRGWRIHFGIGTRPDIGWKQKAWWIFEASFGIKRVRPA